MLKKQKREKKRGDFNNGTQNTPSTPKSNEEEEENGVEDTAVIVNTIITKDENEIFDNDGG